jgi:phosphoserine phosphatase
VESKMKKFEWDDDASEDQNFREWAMMNADERESVGQAPLPEEEARELFKELKESGWLTM